MGNPKRGGFYFMSRIPSLVRKQVIIDGLAVHVRYATPDDQPRPRRPPP